MAAKENCKSARVNDYICQNSVLFYFQIKGNQALKDIPTCQAIYNPSETIYREHFGGISVNRIGHFNSRYFYLNLQSCHLRLKKAGIFQFYASYLM